MCVCVYIHTLKMYNLLCFNFGFFVLVKYWKKFNVVMLSFLFCDYKTKPKNTIQLTLNVTANGFNQLHVRSCRKLNFWRIGSLCYGVVLVHPP